jgi:hypothetical protein
MFPQLFLTKERKADFITSWWYSSVNWSRVQWYKYRTMLWCTTCRRITDSAKLRTRRGSRQKINVDGEHNGRRGPTERPITAVALARFLVVRVPQAQVVPPETVPWVLVDKVPTNRPCNLVAWPQSFQGHYHIIPARVSCIWAMNYRKPQDSRYWRCYDLLLDRLDAGQRAQSYYYTLFILILV